MPDYIALSTCPAEFTYIGLKTDIRFKPDSQNKQWQYRYTYNVVRRYLEENIFNISPASGLSIDTSGTLNGSINGSGAFTVSTISGMGDFKKISQTIRPFNDGGCEQMEVFENWISVSYESGEEEANGWTDLDWVLGSVSLPPIASSLENAGYRLDDIAENVDVQYRDETPTLEERKTIVDYRISQLHNDIGGIWPGGDISTNPWGITLGGTIAGVSTNGGGPVSLSSSMSNMIGISFEITPHGKRGGKFAKVTWGYRTESQLYKITWE